MDDLRKRPALLADLKRIVLRRSKIEEWVDEPFFEKTMKNALVKVGFSQKYIIAQVMAVKEDWTQAYKLTKGKKTGVYLQLMINENSSEKMKWFKIN